MYFSFFSLIFQAITLFGSAQRSDRYAAVKKFCYIERPMASQVRILITTWCRYIVNLVTFFCCKPLVCMRISYLIYF